MMRRRMSLRELMGDLGVEISCQRMCWMSRIGWRNIAKGSPMLSPFVVHSNFSFQMTIGCPCRSSVLRGFKKVLEKGQLACRTPFLSRIIALGRESRRN